MTLPIKLPWIRIKNQTRFQAPPLSLHKVCSIKRCICPDFISQLDAKLESGFSPHVYLCQLRPEEYLYSFISPSSCGAVNAHISQLCHSLANKRSAASFYSAKRSGFTTTEERCREKRNNFAKRKSATFSFSLAKMLYLHFIFPHNIFAQCCYIL